MKTIHNIDIKGIAYFYKQPLELFYKNAVLKNFSKFAKKHLLWSLFFNKTADLRPATLLRKDSNTGTFLWILQNFSEQLWVTSSNGCFCAFWNIQIFFFGKIKKWQLENSDLKISEKNFWGFQVFLLAIDSHPLW